MEFHSAAVAHDQHEASAETLYMPLSLYLPTALSFACFIAFSSYIHTQTLTKV